MNSAGIFDAALSSDGLGKASGYVHLDAPPAHAPSGAIVVPDAHFLFNANFTRSGADLILAGDGRELVLHDYFRGEKRAPLASPDGAHLTGDLVNALTGAVQVSQADGTASAGKVIGHVTKLQGTATAIRNGVSIILHQGDNVEKGDVVQSGSDSTLGVTFIDGTVFGLSSNARMVLNEMVYDPNGSNNSSLISLVAGTISFVAGQTAKHGDMKVDTPVATMGIRGTAVLVEIDFTVPGQGGTPDAKFQVLVEPDGTTGSYVLFDKTTLQPIAVVNQAGQQINISNGLITQTSEPLSPDIQKLITDVFALKFTDNTNPKSTTHFTDISVPETLAPIKLADGASAIPTFLVTNSSGSSSTQNFLGDAGQHFGGPPAVAVLDASGRPSTHFALTELVGKTGDVADLDTISGKINFVDVNVGDQPTASVRFKSFAYANAGHADVSGSLNAQQLQDIAATEVKIIVTPGPGNTNFGSAAWTYSVPDHAFDFLAAGETLTLTYIVRVDNNFAPSNEYTEIPITITVTGTNDAPVITTAAQTIAFSGGTGVSGGSLPSHDPHSGTLTFSDVDLTDTHTVSAKLITPEGDIPPAPYALFEKALTASLATDSTGSGAGTVTWSLADLPVYVADFIPAGQTLTLAYLVTVTDSQGASSEQTVTVTITGTDKPAEVWIATTGGESAAGSSAAPVLLWNDGANWETGLAPTVNDDVIIITDQLHGLTPAFPVTIDAATFAKSVTMNDYGGGAPPELDNQSTLTVGCAFTVNADARVYNFHGATISIGGKAEFLDHSMLVNSGTLLLAGGGVFGATASITNTGTTELTSGILNVFGAVANADDSGCGLIQVDHGAALVLEHSHITGGYLINSGTVHVEAQSATTFDDVSIDNGTGGVIVVDDAGETPAPSTLILDGHTSITGGTLTVGLVGTLEVAGQDVILSGVHVENCGLFSVDPSALLELACTDVTGTGTFSISGTIEATGYSSIGGTVVNNGTIDIIDGTFEVTGSLSGTGTVVIGTGATLQLDGADTQVVTFSGDGAELVLNASSFTGTIEGLAATDKLDLSNIEWGCGTTASYDVSTGVLTVTDSHDHSVSLTLSGVDYTNVHFAGSNDGHGGTLITLNATDDAPVVTTNDQQQSAVVAELQNTTGSSTADPSPAAGGTIHFCDADLTDRPTASISAQSVTWTAADHSDLSASLTAGDVSALEHALTLAQADNTNNGTVAWTYAITDSALDFIGAGQTVTVTSTVAIDDHHGGVVDVPVTVTITGAEDAPVISGETNPPVQTVILAKSPIVLAPGELTNSAGLPTETFDHVSFDSGFNEGHAHRSFYSEALHATFTASSDDAGIVHGSSSVSAAPYVADGAQDDTSYLSIGGHAHETIAFDHQENSFGLYWGSVDSYNSIEFYDGNKLVAAYSGNDLSALQANGGQHSFASNGYVEFLDLAPFDKVVLASSQNAFELDNVSAGTISDSHVKLADPVAGTLTVSDKDVGDTLTASVVGDAVVKYNGSSHLPANVNVDALADAGAVTFDSVTSDGKADTLHWTYSPDSADLDFLEPGDTLTITFQAKVGDGHGSFGMQPLTVTIAGNGAPLIVGSAQNDTFDDVGGGVTIFGRGGNDTFVFNPHFGSATIADFDVSKDAIEIDHSLFATAQDILAAAQPSNHGNDTVITDVAHETITLKGVTIAQLTAHQNDFHFV